MTTNLELKVRQPVAFDTFVEKQIKAGLITAQLQLYLEQLLEQWRVHNQGCFEKGGKEWH